jgi:hypothetical protein
MGKYKQQKNMISPQNIQLIEQIGEGEFGTGKVNDSVTHRTFVE